MKQIAAVALCSIIALSGCSSEKAEESKISEQLAEKGTTELLEEAAEDQYEPPADGRLTEKQVQLYLKVREHEKKIAQVAKKELQAHAKEAEGKEKSLAGIMDSFKAVGSFADLMTADIRAAKELGYNTAEYQWIKEQVLEASGAAMTQKLQEASNAMIDQTYVETKKQYEAATDETTKKMLGEMLAGYEQSRKETASEIDPTVQYNMQLLSKHENALNALAAELAKFEDKPGDAQKGVEELQQNIDKAVQDAQNGSN